MTNRIQLDVAKSTVASATDRLTAADATIARLRDQAGNTAELQGTVNQINSDNAALFMAWASKADGSPAPTIDGNRLAQAHALLAAARLQGDSINAAIEMQQDVRVDALHAKQDAEAKLGVLAMGVVIDEQLPALVSEVRESIAAAHRASAKLDAFARLTVELAHQTQDEPNRSAMFALAQRVRDEATIGEKADLTAEIDAARADLLDQLNALMHAPAAQAVSS
jgi:hypothetical protein